MKCYQHLAGLTRSLYYGKEGLVVDTTRTESWRPVPGYEGRYEVSDAGRVRSLDRYVDYKTGQRVLHRGKALKSQHFQTTGYPYVNLWKNGKGTPRTVHSLVMEAFVGAREKGMEVCHKNGVRTDNRLENLRYGTSTENNLDIIRHGRHTNTNKTHCNRGHSLQDPNLVPSVKKLGRRQCLACVRARARVNYHKELKDQLQEIADSYYAAILKGGGAMAEFKKPINWNDLPDPLDKGVGAGSPELLARHKDSAIQRHPELE